jgi:predicted DNA-binding protein
MKLLHIDDETGEIEFEITKEEEKELQALSNKLGVSIETLIRDAIENYLNKNDEVKEEENENQ